MIDANMSWLRVATLCAINNLPVCSHGMQELRVSLLAGVHNGEIHGSIPAKKDGVTPPYYPESL